MQENEKHLLENPLKTNFLFGATHICVVKGLL